MTYKLTASYARLLDMTNVEIVSTESTFFTYEVNVTSEQMEGLANKLNGQDAFFFPQCK